MKSHQFLTHVTSFSGTSLMAPDAAPISVLGASQDLSPYLCLSKTAARSEVNL